MQYQPDSDDEVELQADGKRLERSAEQENANSLETLDSMGFELDVGEDGDEFMAVKPWLGAIVEPTEPPRINPSKPDDELQLEWVHGYRAQDARNNLFYTASGEIVYTAAALGIVLDPLKWEQRYQMVRARADACRQRCTILLTRMRRATLMTSWPLPSTQMASMSPQGSLVAFPRCSCGTRTRCSLWQSCKAFIAVQ